MLPLTALDLSDCEAFDIGLLRLPCLKWLSIAGQPMSGPGDAALLSIVTTSRQLEHLDLSACSGCFII